MKHKQKVQVLLPMLVILMSFLPVQGYCQSNEIVKKIENDVKKIQVISVEPGKIKPPEVPDTNKTNKTNSTKSTKNTEASTEIVEEAESSLSTEAIVGISAGAVVLLGGAIALAAGGGGGGSDSSPAPPTPPTEEELVGAWQANASQPGSGRTYTGTYQLYSGGSIAYNVLISDGQNFIGVGSWSIVEYKLSVYTDHGSRYIGNFVPGVINTVDLAASNGWYLTLSR